MLTAPAGQEPAIFRALTTGHASLFLKVHCHYRQNGLCADFAVRLDLDSERCVWDVATAFVRFGGGADWVRARRGKRGWKRVAEAFAPLYVPVEDATPSPEARTARALQEEALKSRATDGARWRPPSAP